MTRRPIGLLVTLALGLLVAPLVAAIAQPRAKPARIAFLRLPPAPPASTLPPVVVGLAGGTLR